MKYYKKKKKFIMTNLNTCIRCGRVCKEKEIHLFQGGEYRQKLAEVYFQHPVSICTKPCCPEDFGLYDVNGVMIKNGQTFEEIEKESKEILDKLYKTDSINYASFLKSLYNNG